MGSILNSRISARVGVNQARTLAHADAIADGIDAKVVRLWKRALRLIALKPLPVDVRTQLGAILRKIQTLAIKGLDKGLREIVKQAHTAAREEVLAEAPRAVIATALTLAAPARPDLTEARRLNPEQRAQVEAQLFPALDHDETTAIITRPTAGTTWQARIAAQSGLAPPEQLANIVIQGISQGQTIQAMARTMLPAVQGVRTSARRVARTEGMRVAHEARMDCYAGLGDLVAGYQIHSTMDWRVRPHHAARNGTVYYVRPKPGQQSTAHMPRPPLEEDGTVAHNCRCYLTPVLDVDPDIESNPAARALFVDNDHKLVQDPNVYSDWFANASDQERRWAVGARRLSAITAGLPAGQAPTWAHFIDPTTGQLLQLERLTAETPARREARMARVAEVLAERERLARQVQRFGYLTAEDGGEPLPVADLTPPAPHPYTAPESPAPTTPEPLPLPEPVEQDRIDAEREKFSREAGKGGAFQGEAVKADPTEYIPFQWQATRFPFKLEGPTGVAVSHEVYKPVLRPGAKLDKTSDSALKREWQELMEKDKLTMADLQYAEEKTTLVASPDGTRVLLATPEQAAKAMGLKPAKVREYDQIAAATWRIQFGKELLASWQEKANQAEEIWRQTREMEGPPPTRHPEQDQGNNRAWIVDGIVFRVYDESPEPKLTRGVKTAALSLWRDKQAENLRWAVNIPIDHRAWKKEIKVVADQVESLEKKLRGKVDRFGAALDVMTPTGPQVTAPAPPPPQVNVVRGEADPMPDGADDIAMDRYGEVVNLAQRAFGKGTKSLPLFNALGELSGEQLAKVALHVGIDPATLPDVVVGTGKRRDYLYAQIIKRQPEDKLIDVEAISAGVDPQALRSVAEQGWAFEISKYQAELEAVKEVKAQYKQYTRMASPEGKPKPWPPRNSPAWNDSVTFPHWDKILPSLQREFEWSTILFVDPETDLAAAGENVESSDPSQVLWSILMRHQAGGIEKPDKVAFYRDQIYLVRDDPNFAYDPERPVVPVSTEPFNWDDDTPAPAEPPMQPAEEPERVWDDEEGEWVTAPTAVATPDPDPWDEDPFARGAVAPPLAAEQPEPDEERRWEDEESDANWEPAGAAQGGDPWDFPTEAAAAEPAEDERRWEDEEEGDAYGYKPEPQETVEPEPKPEPEPVPEPKPKKLPKYIPAGRLKSNAQVVFPAPIKGNTGAELVAYEWAWQIEDVQTADDVVAKKVSNWDRADVSDETGRLIVHKFDVKAPDGTVKTVSLETAARLLGYTPGEAQDIANIATTAKTYAKMQMAISVLDAAIKETDEIKAEVDAMEPPPVIEVSRTSPATRKWMIGNVEMRERFGIMAGDHPYEIGEPIPAELVKRGQDLWRDEQLARRKKESGYERYDSFGFQRSELEKRAKKVKLRLDLAIKKAGEKKRLEEAVRLERRALRAGITLGEAFGAVPHRCLYLNPMRRPIHESVLSGRGIRVNREAGTIANVKILGLVSENGRQYLPAAIQAAKKLYEGVHVNIDHPKDSPDQQRSAYDRFGKLTRIRWVEGEGLYGDLVYLKTHPMAERICEAAERMPDAFGMSHNAQGEGEENKDGVFVVSKIVEVRHVDLVADPATTKSLSESKMLEATAGPFANNWPLEPEPTNETQRKINNKRFDERHVFLTKNKWERKGDTYVNKWNPKAKLTGKEVMLLPDDSWDALKGKIASGYMEAESFTKYDKWKAACQSKHGDCAFKRDGAVVIATDKAGKQVGSFKPSSAYNSGGQGAGPPGKGTMEATGATKMDTVEIVSQLKDLLDQLAMSLGGEEEVPSEEAYDGEEEKPAMEAEDEKTAVDDETIEADGEGSEMEEEPPVEKKKPSMEGRQAKAIRNARKLCEAVGLNPSRDLLQDLASMPRETAARQVQRLALAQKARAPRSGSYMTEGRAGTGATDSAGIPTGPALFTWLAN